MKFTKRKFIFRTITLFVAFFVLFVKPEIITNIPLIIKQLLWLLLMLEQLVVVFPKTNNKTPFGKLFSRHYKEVENYDKSKLLKESTIYNKRSVITFFLWILMIYVIYLIYKINLIDDNHVFFLSVVFYFFDHFCINVWCPFHKILVRNKCCNTCRIFNWGHFMIYSPLIVINNNYYTTSLVLMALSVLIQWEIQHYLYPQRFYEISNENLKCSSCDIECRFTKKIV